MGSRFYSHAHSSISRDRMESQKKGRANIMNSALHQFKKSLNRARRVVSWTLLTRSLLIILTSSILFFAIYALLDLAFALSQRAIISIDLVIVGLLIITILFVLLRALQTTYRDVSLLADRHSIQRRGQVLAAWELTSTPNTELSDFEKFLVDKNVDAAVSELNRIDLWKSFSLPSLRKWMKWFLISVAAISILFALPFFPTRTLLTRIFLPYRDTPPWSPYKFEITPAHPEVHYGETLELQVNITGAPLREPVYLVTRGSHQTFRTACFQESPTRFLQKLENVVEPLEFCFSTGKARSRWHPIQLLMKPRISLARIRVTPPAYCKLPPRDLILGGEDITGQIGSKMALTITSNRPVADGTLTFTPALASQNPPRQVKAKRVGPHTLSFEWNLSESGRIEARIRDVQGSLSSELLTATLKAIPDAPPEISIDEPSLFALATPTSTVPMSISASDDFGLQQVHLLRAVIGFRDRVLPLKLLEGKEFQSQSQLDLRTLGVKPGQRLEFYVEARDNNPSGTGHATSDAVQIEIISEEEYGLLVRNRTTLEDFAARYQVLAEQMKKLIDSLKQLKEKSKDSPEYQAALKDALQNAKAMKELSDKLGADFAAFDLEKKLTPILKELSDRTSNISQQLEKAVSDPSSPPPIDEMLASLGNSEKEVGREAASAKEIYDAGKVMRHAAAFNRILNAQQDVVRRLKRAAATRAPDHDLLASTSMLQTSNMEALKKFLDELPTSAESLSEHEGYEKLRKDALEFASRLEQSGALGHMKQAVHGAKNQDEKGSLNEASLALDLLKSFLSKSCDSGSEFGGLCQGRLSFKPKSDVMSTCQQMLASLFSAGKGQGSGSGSGPGGDGGEDGYSTEGNTSINTPVFGPQRTSFQNPSGQGHGRGGKGTGSSIAIKQSPTETLPEDPDKEKSSTVFPLEMTPEKYREAIRKYFEMNQ